MSDLPGIKLYFSVPDHYPAFRVDIAVLFPAALREQGVATDWFMANNGPDERARQCDYLGQSCILPYKFPGHHLLAKVMTRGLYMLSDCWQLLRAARGDYDILQTRDKYIASLVALLAARLAGKPFVYWCSYPFPEHALALARQKPVHLRWLFVLHARIAEFILYRLVMRHADHCFVQSEQMRRDVAAHGVPRGRMTPVPMGVSPHLLGLRQSVPIVAGRVVYLGTLASIRHLEMVIDAFALVYARCPAATLLMVGEGNKPHERQVLEAQAAALGIAAAVSFTGFVPIEEAWAHAASAAVCLSPIYPTPVLDCGSPTKLYEYMALGRPVVCNTHPEQTEVIAASGAGLAVAWNSQAFADAMAWMLTHSEQAEEMASKGPAWVAAQRTYPTIARTVAAQYQQLLKRVSQERTA